MIRLAISVEGRTEEEFVRQVLADYLRRRNVEPTPVLLGRARSTGQGGGNVTVERLTQDMVRLYPDFNAVTSLVDFYGFKDKGSRTVDELEEYLHEQIGNRIARSWNETRVFPYVQKYEFEGLLFSDVSAFARVGDIGMPKNVEELRNARSQFPTPEDINDNRDTAPSKRIEKVIPQYQKVVHGPLLAEEIGLDTIRAECPRFDAWVARMESLASRLEL